MQLILSFKFYIYFGRIMTRQPVNGKDHNLTKTQIARSTFKQQVTLSHIREFTRGTERKANGISL